jgi:HK97 gp10 family phage protein
MGIELDVTGFASSLDRAAAAMAHPAAANRDAAAVVLRLAETAAPRKSGRLAASGHAEADDAGGVVTFTADYALFVNAGTRYMRARPFLSDAIDQAVNPVTDIYAAAVSAAFDTVHD